MSSNDTSHTGDRGCARIHIITGDHPRAVCTVQCWVGRNNMDFIQLLGSRKAWLSQSHRLRGKVRQVRRVLLPTGLWGLRSACSAWVSGVWVLYGEAGSGWQGRWSQRAEGPGSGGSIDACLGSKQKRHPQDSTYRVSAGLGTHQKKHLSPAPPGITSQALGDLMLCRGLT